MERACRTNIGMYLGHTGTALNPTEGGMDPSLLEPQDGACSKVSGALAL